MPSRHIEAFLRGERRGLLPAIGRLPLLVPALAFGVAAALRRRIYRRGWVRAARLSIPVLSVGNIVVGGTGKTPFVRALCRRLMARGERPLVLSRGYGGRSDRTALDDEGESLQRDLPEVRIAQGRNRGRAAEAHLRQAGGPTVAVLDDGAQALGIHRDLEILLVDAAHPFGSGWPLPAGTLREFPGQLRIADVIVITRADEVPAGALERLRMRLGTLAPRSTVVVARHVADRLLPGSELPASLAGRRVFLLSGIADPASFARQAASLGAVVVGEEAYGDHHRFTRDEWRAAAAGARRRGATLLLATGKDEPKLAPLGDPGLPYRFLEVAVELDAAGSAALDGHLDRVLRGPGRGS